MSFEINEPPFRLVHQTLCIREVNFDKHSLFGFVDINLKATRFPLEKVTLNCRHSRLYRVCLNGCRQVSFDYRDPTLLVCPDDIKQRNLDYFCGAYMQAIEATNFDIGNGELSFTVPYDMRAEVERSEELAVRIEFSLESKNAGVHFVNSPSLVPKQTNKPTCENKQRIIRHKHMFTYYYENCNKLWFPHVDSPLMPCTWRVEVTVPNDLLAICSGELLDVVEYESGNLLTFIYHVDIPVCANKIGIVVGDFEMMPDQKSSEITHFCSPGLSAALTSTVENVVDCIEFLEQHLSSRLPFQQFKTVFVEEAFTQCLPFAGMCIGSVALLHTEKIIDQVPHTLRLLGHAIASQFFGCFIASASWSDSWTVFGISKYIAAQFEKEIFGLNEYLYSVRETIRKVCEYEEANGEIILDNSLALSNGHKSDNVNACKLYANLMSPSYVEMMKLKAFLVVRLVGENIGPEILTQVINKMISLAINVSKQACTSWSSMQISTNSLLNSVSSLCGKDLNELMNMWVFKGGHPQFTVSFDFNRKRNCVELVMKQHDVTLAKKGLTRYVGPVTVSIQELDGPFTHSLVCEDLVSKHDISCHSKNRRIKKRKIPMAYGEEIDIDFKNLDQDMPVLWLRFDPQMELICHVKMNMPDVLWQLMLRYERVALAQFDAVENLKKFESPESRQALVFTIEQVNFFYRVRIAAFESLVFMATKCAATWQATQMLIDIGRSMFSSGACNDIVQSNDFTNLEEYFMQKEFIKSLGNYRNVQKFCPDEIVSFILSWLKFNDNRRNAYSDAMYKANLIDALSETISPSTTIVTSPDMLTPEMKLIVEELVRYLNIDKLVPSYKLSVTVSCLKAMRNLQRNGHIPNDPTLFKSYCSEHQFVDVRLAAIESLIDFTRDDANSYILSFLLDIIENDRDVYVRHCTLQMLCASPPFNRTDANPLNTESTVDRLWTLVNKIAVGDSRLRCSAIEFYHALYGRGRPYCLPKPQLGVVVNLREKRADVTRGEMPQLTGMDQHDHDMDQSMDTSIESLNVTVTSSEQSQTTHGHRGDSRNVSLNPSASFNPFPTEEEDESDLRIQTLDVHASGRADLDEDSQFFATNPNIENVTDEEFLSNREPMYLPPFSASSSSSTKGGKKRNKKEKEKKRGRKKKDADSVASDRKSANFRLSPPSSDDSD